MRHQQQIADYGTSALPGAKVPCFTQIALIGAFRAHCAAVTRAAWSASDMLIRLPLRRRRTRTRQKNRPGRPSFKQAMPATDRRQALPEARVTVVRPRGAQVRAFSCRSDCSPRPRSRPAYRG